MAEESDKTAPKRDPKGHMMASWDEHPACRICLRQLGIFCTKATPCSVCIKWDEATWQRLDRAVQDKERRKAKSAELTKSKKTDTGHTESPCFSPLAKKSKTKGEGGSKARQPDVPLATPSRVPVAANGSDPGSSAKPAHVTKPKSSSVGPATIPLQPRPAQQSTQAPGTQTAVTYQLNAMGHPQDPRTGNTVRLVPVTSHPIQPATTDQSFAEMLRFLTQQASELRSFQQQSTELQLKVAQLSQLSTQPVASQQPLSQPAPHDRKKKKRHRSSSSSSRSDHGRRRSRDRDRERRSPARSDYYRSNRRSVFERLGKKKKFIPTTSDRHSSYRSSSDRDDRGDRRPRRQPSSTVTRATTERRRGVSRSPPHLTAMRSQVVRHSSPRRSGSPECRHPIPGRGARSPAQLRASSPSVGGRASSQESQDPRSVQASGRESADCGQPVVGQFSDGEQTETTQSYAEQDTTQSFADVSATAPIFPLEVDLSHEREGSQSPFPCAQRSPSPKVFAAEEDEEDEPPARFNKWESEARGEATKASPAKQLFTTLAKGSKHDKSEASSDEDDEEEWNKAPNESVLLTRITQEKAYWLIQEKLPAEAELPELPTTLSARPPPKAYSNRAPFSPYVAQRQAVLDQVIAGKDPDPKGERKPLKYPKTIPPSRRIPKRILPAMDQFPLNPRSINGELLSYCKSTTGKAAKDKPTGGLWLRDDSLTGMEKDGRTLIALASHADAMAAAQRAILDKMLQLGGLSSSMRGLLEMLSDVENTRATDLQHILDWACRYDANMLLLRRQSLWNDLTFSESVKASFYNAPVSNQYRLLPDETLTALVKQHKEDREERRDSYMDKAARSKPKPAPSSSSSKQPKPPTKPSGKTGDHQQHGSFTKPTLHKKPTGRGGKNKKP